MKTICFFVNGIATWPGDAKNWNKRAVTWVHLNSDAHAQNDEYFTTALTVWIHEAERIRVFTELLNRFKGWRIVVMAHSNGARIATAAIKAAWPVKIDELHLVAGAMDADFERNGLNRMLVNRKVGRLLVYRGGRDWAMCLCNTLAGKGLFGIYPHSRPLGLSGPVNVHKQAAPFVYEIIRDTFGHSTWFADREFERTMKHITLTV